MKYNTLTLSEPAPGVVLATLNRPHRSNAITFEMFDEFVRLQREVDETPDARVLILTGSGRAFCAGLDLDHVAELSAMSAEEMLVGQTHWAASVSGFHTMATPVIAAVNGAAAGAGMGLALAADIRIASSAARFNAAFVKVGLSGGDVGSSYLLPRIVGTGPATEILLTGNFVDAHHAYRIGLVTSLVEPEDLLGRALDIALTICANSPIGMRLTKDVLRINATAPSLDSALSVENRNQVLATRTSDMTEALNAFRNKRAPVFTGR
ncbi:enoyl-CoA hydratase/isomerase family protein [Rhodococcus sp. P1Y]|uniref:enoyl-CoA hydratase/isomerase family protein n=1 Tax=Rhodococcus sp. P1Y TaxID=1302308 RepID=UPI000EAFE66D|nr:enoyl-CoA hydratase-related protein [Rhodococcus sp. P1Y]AYJ48329.1 enoyl-CoA hydratase/isomerase family protein [Rhodococcus sp. P1Y]